MNRKEEMREALKAALPFLVNDSPGGCAGEYDDCAHCLAIRKVRAALRASAAPEEGMNHRSAGDGSTKETINISGCLIHVRVRKLRKPRWPDGAWECFCGNLSATGSTRENALYNFERAASTVVDHQSDNSEPQEVIVNSALAPATEGGTVAHLRQIKAFASVINERNFLDIALHISRQADDALALTSAQRNKGAE